MEIDRKVNSLNQVLRRRVIFFVKFISRIIFPLCYIIATFGFMVKFAQDIEGSETLLSNLSMISFTVGMFVLIFGTEMKREIEDEISNRYFMRSMKIALGFLVTGAFFLVMMLGTPLMANYDSTNTFLESDTSLSEGLGQAADTTISLVYLIIIFTPTAGLGVSIWFLLRMILDLVLEDLSKLSDNKEA